MCIIAEITPNTPRLTYRWHEEFTDNNPDGFGYVAHNPAAPFGERLTVFKTMSAAAFWQALDTIQQDQTQTIIAHYRQATHGLTDLERCHPFTINTKHAGPVVVTHNGMLSKYPHTGNKADSDTTAFVYGFLAPMLHDMRPRALARHIRSDAFRWMIETLLGTGNRLVITDQDGHVTYNDDIWHTRTTGQLDGMRLSNTYAWGDIDAPARPYAGRGIVATRDAWYMRPEWMDDGHDSPTTSRGSYHTGKYTTPAVMGTAPTSTAAAPATYSAAVSAQAWMDADEQDDDSTAPDPVECFVMDYEGRPLDEVEAAIWEDPTTAALVLFHLLNNY